MSQTNMGAVPDSVYSIDNVVFNIGSFYEIDELGGEMVEK